MEIEAAVFRDKSGIPTFEKLELTGPLSGEVLVRMVATGVCHTDIKVAQGGFPVSMPIVLGHEGAGVVEAVGEGVQKVKPGDHVVMTFSSCGTCPSCSNAKPSYCHHTNHFVSDRAEGAHYLSSGSEPIQGDFFSQSSFSTFSIGNERSVVKVREDAPLNILGPMGCGFQAGAGAILNDLQVGEDDTLAVFGVGALGLTAIMAAKFSGVKKVIAIDRHAERLKLAKEFGAHDIIVAGTEPVAPEIMDLTSGGVNYSLDTTGVEQVMTQAVDILAPLGVCGLVAPPSSGPELSVHIGKLLMGRSVRGIMEGGSNPDVFIPKLINLFMEGRFPVDRLVKEYQFEDIRQAFADSESGSTVKPILNFTKN